MQDLNNLYYFVKVVEHGGFAPAGRALGVPKSKLSRRIALLEDQLGTRLIQRSSRVFRVTEIGEEFHMHCLAMLVEAEAAQELIDRRRAEPRGVVRVSCPSSVLYFQVSEMVARFMVTCPHVDVHLVSTNRRVDVLREGFDVAIRVRFQPLEESDLMLKILAESQQSLVAAPSLLTKSQAPRVPADLTALPSLAWETANTSHEWHLISPEGATATIRHSPRLVSEDMVTLRKAALLGVGVARMPNMVVAKDIEAGTLVKVLPDWTLKTGIIHALFPSRRGLLPSVRAFLDHLGREYAALEMP